MGRPLPSELVDSDDKEVVLGLPGAWAEDTNEPADHYTTKIGGQLDWPVPLQDVNDDLLKCGVCGGYLGLVAQVYAPLTLYGAKLDERSLFILGCPSASCGVDRTRYVVGLIISSSAWYQRKMLLWCIYEIEGKWWWSGLNPKPPLPELLPSPSRKLNFSLAQSAAHLPVFLEERLHTVWVETGRALQES